MAIWIWTLLAGAAPGWVPMQGVLSGPTGAIDGAQPLLVQLWLSDTAPSPVWDDSFTVAFDEGRFAVVLGSGRSLDPGVFHGANVYVSTGLVGGPQSARVALGLTPYAASAAYAEVADHLGDLAPEDVVTWEDTIPWSQIDPAGAPGDGLVVSSGRLALDRASVYDAVDELTAALDGRYLQASALTPYLTSALAASTYLTQATASSTYLSQANAASTYATRAYVDGASGVSAGTYGSSTLVPSLTVDARGRVTGATTVAISGVAPGGGAGGDLSGSFPSPTVARLQGRPVSSAAPSNGQFLRWDGSNWAPAAAITGVSINYGDCQNIGYVGDTSTTDIVGYNCSSGYVMVGVLGRRYPGYDIERMGGRCCRLVVQ